MNLHLPRCLLIVVILITTAFAQEKDVKYMTPAEAKAHIEKWDKMRREALERQNNSLRKSAHHPGHDKEKRVVISGNQITTVIYNYGSISRPRITDLDLQWPKSPEKRLGYAYEFGPLVAAEVADIAGNLIHIVDDGFIEPADGDYQPGTAVKWGWLPQVGFSDPASPELATITAKDNNRDGKPDSWPEAWYNAALGRYVWPAFLGDDATAPDEEAVYRVDDFSNAEFKYYPFPNDTTRRGLGLEMDARFFQFNNPLAEDIIFFVYTVTNVSGRDLDKVYLGMFGDPHVGGANDFADDYAGFIGPLDQTFPFNARNMLYAYDKDGRGGGKATGYFGYKFLESPTLSNDGKDNDGDQIMDESPFNDAGVFALGPIGIYGQPKLHWSGDEDGDWNAEFDDVGVDGIVATKDYGEGDARPSQLYFTDTNNNGRYDLGEPSSESRLPGMRFAGSEPNFGFRDIAESDQLGLTSFNAILFGGNNRPKNDELMWEKMTGNLENTDIEQETDNVFIYGCGPFKLAAGESQRFSIALILGENLPDLVQNAITAQQVFEADYRFAKPPLKPQLVAVPGDRKVTLYWDTRAETSFDPFLARGTGQQAKGFDFEGYRIYRSEDFSFDDTKIITDQNGLAFYSVPLSNARNVPAQFDLINEYSGFSPVETRGARFNLGDNTGLVHSYVDSNNVVNGKRYFYAVVAYDHGENTLQIPPTETQRTIDRDPLTGQFSLDVNTAMVIAGPPAAGYVGPKLDDSNIKRVTGNATGRVEVQFIDPLLVGDNKQYELQFTPGSKPTDPPVYSIADLKPLTLSFTARDTVFADLPIEHLVPGTLTLRDAAGATIDPSRYEVNYVDGRIRGKTPGALRNGATYSATFQYYPVYNSTALNREDSNPVFDGVKVFVQSDQTALDADRSGWKVSQNGTNFTYKVAISTTNPQAGPRPYPGDIEMRFTKYDTTAEGKLINPADTSLTRVVSNFRVIDTETGRKLSWFANEPIASLRQGRWDWHEKIHIFHPKPTPTSPNIPMYEVQFAVPPGQTPKYPGDGDVFLFFSRKPFDAGDKYQFTTEAAKFDPQAAQQELKTVYVVPNPYVAFGASESAGSRDGTRDERRLEFRNLPEKCTIRIYTITGELVDTVEKNDQRDFVAWNVLTLESQATAYGVYIYHVDAPNVGTKIGRFAVIK